MEASSSPPPEPEIGYCRVRWCDQDICTSSKDKLASFSVCLCGCIHVILLWFLPLVETADYLYHSGSLFFRRLKLDLTCRIGKLCLVFRLLHDFCPITNNFCAPEGSDIVGFFGVMSIWLHIMIRTLSFLLHGVMWYSCFPLAYVVFFLLFSLLCLCVVCRRVIYWCGNPFIWDYRLD